MFWTSSNSLAFSSAIETCAVKAHSRDSSSSVNGPPRLFRTWVTPMVLPSLLITGTHRIERVKKPVCLSNPGLKRRSAYAWGMFTVSPEVNTAPAIPAWFGRRISVAPKPSPTLVNSSLVFSSLMNSVERSALSIRVASLITFCKSAPRSISEVTSETTSRNAISFSRVFCMRSTNWVLCSATAACVVISCRSARSPRVKRPFFLFRHWAAPMISPLAVRIGTQRMLLVT